MSQVTEIIDAYKAGDFTREELAEKLGRFNYTRPQRFGDTQRNDHPLDKAENYDPIFGDENSWDEVVAAFYGGVLSEDDYFAIVDVAEQHAGR